MKFTVGKKIGSGYALAVAALVIIGAVAYQSTVKLTDTSQWVEHTHEVLQNLELVLSGMKDAETGQRGFIITGEERYLEPYQSALGTVIKRIGTIRDLTSDNDSQQRQLDTLEPLVVSKFAELKETIELRRSKEGDLGFQAALQVVKTDGGKVVMDDIRKVVSSMKEAENDLMRTRQTDAKNSADRTVNVIIFGNLVAVILLVLAGWFITQNIARPLESVTSAADKIAEGDLSVEFTGVDRSDEVGVLMKTFQRMSRSLTVLSDRAKQIAEGDLTAQITPRSERDVLGNAFANMVASLRRIMQELLEAVNVLAAAASEIMASTTQLAASAAETATAVTETTATVEEVKQTSLISSQKAKAVAEESQKASEVAKGGKRSVDQTIEGMSGIRQQMGMVAESILSLSAQGQAIGEIISTVDDLAAQSKLLAVNASIEAAKAGEEGRGFSVVAQEVKSLAEQSKQATTQVRGILSDIQKATGSAVLATEQGSKAVEAGVRQSGTAGESIGALSDSIAAAAQAAMQIAATSQQQFVGMDQVAQAMENIKLASTQTVASTKQAETAAQQLHDLGQKLKQLLTQFKV